MGTREMWQDDHEVTYPFVLVNLKLPVHKLHMFWYSLKKLGNEKKQSFSAQAFDVGLIEKLRIGYPIQKSNAFRLMHYEK